MDVNMVRWIRMRRTGFSRLASMDAATSMRVRTATDQDVARALMRTDIRFSETPLEIGPCIEGDGMGIALVSSGDPMCEVCLLDRLVEAALDEEDEYVIAPGA